MTCNKCKMVLPDDSEFCQYCGTKIDTVDMAPVNAMRGLLKFQAEAMVDNMRANAESQPNNEDHADFGLVPEMPIYTHALKSVLGEEEYLDKLYIQTSQFNPPN